MRMVLPSIPHRSMLRHAADVNATCIHRLWRALCADAPVEEGKPRRKLNFRRLLLNKCQEEFEKGDAAMAAVAEREAKEAAGGGAAEEEDKVCSCWDVWQLPGC
jgi:hypothetical protein